ncbi:MAG: DUF6538 domain-containing protein, partial [Devosia sp.]
MAAKCAYVERVGAVYYVRKRIPHAWKGRVTGDVLRLSLRTKDRVKALILGLEALAVFEDLLRMEPEDALKQLMRRLIDEQLLRPHIMTGADLVRRRALGSVGAKIIRQARQELRLGEHLDAIYQELVHLNHVTVQGEAIYDRRLTGDLNNADSGGTPDLSSFDAVLEALGAAKLEAKPAAATPLPLVRPAVPLKSVEYGETEQKDVYTLRALLDDYFKQVGKTTGSDNRANLERVFSDNHHVRYRQPPWPVRS